MSAGRKPDEAPPNYKTVSEVAAILGVTSSNVRQMIQSGRLPYMADDNGDPIRTAAGEPRYYIPYLAVEEELRRRQRAVTPGDIEKVEDQLQAQAARVIEEMVKKLQEHDTKIAREIEKGHDDTIVELKKLVERITSLERQMAGLRKSTEEYQGTTEEYQDEMLGFVRKVVDNIPEDRQKERKGFWEKLFGG